VTGGGTLLKGTTGRQQGGGGWGKSADAWRGTRRGALAPTSGDSLGGVAQPAAARPRRACPHSGGRRQVTDELGLDGSGKVKGREARGARGPAGGRNGVGRARMISDAF
jgi:hypothetical protein